MSQMIPDPNNEGQEIEVFSKEEITEKEAKIAELSTDVEKYKSLSAEKTENFRKLRDISTEEKTAMGEEKVAAMARAEAAETEIQALKDQISGDAQKRIDNDTATALAKYHGGNETLKAALEANFKMITMEGNDTATIEERAKLAASMEIGKNNENHAPLRTFMNGGGSPAPRDGGDKPFTDSEKGKAALGQMGFNEPEKK